MQNRLEKVENASNELLTKRVKSIECRTVKKRTKPKKNGEDELTYFQSYMEI
jgi:hypothetical protein